MVYVCSVHLEGDPRQPERRFQQLKSSLDQIKAHQQQTLGRASESISRKRLGNAR